VADGEAVTDWGLERLDLGPGGLHLVGRGLGGRVAMQLAARLTVAGGEPASVTLITPPRSLRTLLAAPRRRPKAPRAHSRDLIDALRSAGATVTVRQLPGTDPRSLPRTPDAMSSLGGWLAAEAA